MLLILISGGIVLLIIVLLFAYYLGAFIKITIEIKEIGPLKLLYLDV